MLNKKNMENTKLVEYRSRVYYDRITEKDKLVTKEEYDAEALYIEQNKQKKLYMYKRDELFQRRHYALNEAFDKEKKRLEAEYSVRKKKLQGYLASAFSIDNNELEEHLESLFFIKKLQDELKEFNNNRTVEDKVLQFVAEGQYYTIKSKFLNTEPIGKITEVIYKPKLISCLDVSDIGAYLDLDIFDEAVTDFYEKYRIIDLVSTLEVAINGKFIEVEYNSEVYNEETLIR